MGEWHANVSSPFSLLFYVLVAEKVIDSICYQTKARPNQYQVHVKIPPLRNEPYYSHRKIVAGIVDQTISLYYNFFFSSGLTMREGESMEERCSMSGAWPIIAFVQSTLNVRRGRS